MNNTADGLAGKGKIGLVQPKLSTAQLQTSITYSKTSVRGACKGVQPLVHFNLPQR